MTTERVMLLIDADNVSIDVMEQAVYLLHKQHGALHVRRAYCTAESAVKHQAAFKRLGIKPMVNLAAGKNSTDIAMAVDAIDLVVAERPDVVVIASSDSDFAPLVQRLREKGCIVRGIGQHGKTGDETQDVYDDYTVLEHRKSAAAAERSAPSRRTGGARKAATKRGTRSAARAAPDAAIADVATLAVVPPPTPASAVDVDPGDASPTDSDASRDGPARDAAPTPARAPRKTAARKTAKARPAAKKAPAAKKSSVATAPKSAARKRRANSAATASDASAATVANGPAIAEPTPPPAPPPRRAAPPESTIAPRATASAGNGPRRSTNVDEVLGCLPELQAGQPLALNVAVQRLREAQLLGRNTSSLKLFSQLGDRFELLPPDKPSQVRLR